MATRKREVAPQDIFEIHAGYCGMFSNPARLRLVWTLGAGERTVTSLARQLKLSVSTCSRHLAKLRDKGVVVARRQGAHLHYHVASPCFLEGCQQIRKGILEVLRHNRLVFGTGDDS